MTMRPARFRRRQAYTLVELMFATAIFGLIIAFVVWASVDTARIGARITTFATAQSQARNALEGFSEDIHDASTIAANGTTYVSQSGTSYTASQTTVIISIPEYFLTNGTLNNSGYTYDNSGQPTSASYVDHVVYHLVGNSAPYTLNRFIDVPNGGCRTAVADYVVARNVNSVTFTYVPQGTGIHDSETMDINLSCNTYGSAGQSNNVELCNTTSLRN